MGNRYLHRHRERDRLVKGERYVRAYKLEQWINRCVGCGAVGHKPWIPDEEHRHRTIRKLFPPLEVDGLSMCEQCQLKD